MVNGRFQHAEAGGFRRYAEEVLRRLDDAEVVRPPAAVGRGAAGRAWEQTALARRAAGRALLSPIGSGPLRHRRHVVVLHDLLALEHPEWVSERYARGQAWFLPRLAAGAAHLVVPSEAVAASLADRLGVAREDITVAPPGLSDTFLVPGGDADADREHALRERLRLGEDRRLVLGMVSTTPRKNSAHLLDVLATVSDAVDDAVAVVVGHDGPARLFGHRTRPRHPAVTDLGAVDDATLAALYRLAAVFIWLPHAEGFGMPVLEAAAAGTPVVTTAVPAALEHPTNAVVVAATDRDAARSAVVRLLERPPPPTGLAPLLARCSWERTTAAITGALARV
jgi:glycosyltransferase involved in cell wall biosynthesis